MGGGGSSRGIGSGGGGGSGGEGGLVGEGGPVGGGGWGRGRGHFIHLAIGCTITLCFALKGLRTMRREETPMEVDARS